MQHWYKEEHGGLGFTKKASDLSRNSHKSEDFGGSELKGDKSLGSVCTFPIQKETEGTTGHSAHVTRKGT